MLEGGVPCADGQPDATEEEEERDRCIAHVLQEFDRPKLPNRKVRAMEDPSTWWSQRRSAGTYGFPPDGGPMPRCITA